MGYPFLWHTDPSWEWTSERVLQCPADSNGRRYRPGGLEVAHATGHPEPWTSADPGGKSWESHGKVMGKSLRVGEIIGMIHGDSVRSFSLSVHKILG